ncbi:hypothetical protein CRM94_13115 [Burkholderia gladioli]|uniref:Uncharacterized protein n=2 Tax=Burkholderia gladioli TaxID=28095 RepID=A0A2A7SHI6_BURGA|nr:hypothetical protein CO712_24625 [Burkholderia gladioli pv. gladioli]PEH43011.1 hypothetical protein CRM94_13115 [Burkholderia gladioli]
MKGHTQVFARIVEMSGFAAASAEAAARCAEARASRAWERRGAALPEPTNLSSRLRASARVDGAARAGLLGFSGFAAGFAAFAKAIRAILPLMGLATLLVALLHARR